MRFFTESEILIAVKLDNLFCLHSQKMFRLLHAPLEKCACGHEVLCGILHTSGISYCMYVRSPVDLPWILNIQDLLQTSHFQEMENVWDYFK